MTDLRTAAQQALEALDAYSWEQVDAARTALKAALAEPVLQTCNCRWDGEMQMQQCTLHEAHVDAIKEWAQRAKFAEKKLAALAEPVYEPVQEPVAWLVTDCIGERYLCFAKPQDTDLVLPLYAAPPRKPLTEEEILSLFRTSGSPTAFARAIERAHGIT